MCGSRLSLPPSAVSSAQCRPAPPGERPPSRSGHPAFQGGRLEFGVARGEARSVRVSAVPVFDDLGGALQRADLTDPRDGPAIPHDAEREVLVGGEPLSVDSELHDEVLTLELPGHLPDLDDHEFHRLDRDESDDDIDDPAVEVRL